MLGGFGVLLRDAGFVGYAVNVSFTTAVFFAFLAGAPYVMIELMDRPSSEYGLYFMLNAVSYMAGNYASGRLATRIGPDRMILTGSIVAAGGAGLLTALVLGTDMIPLLLFGPVMFAGFATGPSLPSAKIGSASCRDTVCQYV